MESRLKTLPITKNELGERKREILSEIEMLKEYHKNRDAEIKARDERQDLQQSIENGEQMNLRAQNNKYNTVREQLEKDIEKLEFKVRFGEKEQDELCQQNHKMKTPVNKIATNANQLKSELDKKEKYFKKLVYEKDKADEKCQDLADQVKSLEADMQLDF